MVDPPRSATPGRPAEDTAWLSARHKYRADVSASIVSGARGAAVGTEGPHGIVRYAIPFRPSRIPRPPPAPARVRRGAYSHFGRSGYHSIGHLRRRPAPPPAGRGPPRRAGLAVTQHAAGTHETCRIARLLRRRALIAAPPPHPPPRLGGSPATIGLGTATPQTCGAPGSRPRIGEPANRLLTVR